MTALVIGKPSLKKTIIDFFEGAKKSYAKDGKLSRAARKYLICRTDGEKFLRSGT